MAWRFNWIDLAVLIIVIRAAYVGTLRGVWVELLRLVSVVGAVAVGANLTVPLATQLAALLPWDITVIEAIFFFGLTVVALVLLTLVARWAGRSCKQHAMALWNQAIAGAMGFTSGVLLAGLVVWVVYSMPWDYLRASVTERSLTGAVALRIIRLAVHGTAKLCGGVPASSEFLNSAL